MRKKDFIVKSETLNRNKKGKREYLNDSETNDMMKELNQYFENMFDLPRIRVGSRQTIETLISEECLLLASFLRDERKDWIPRYLPN